MQKCLRLFLGLGKIPRLGIEVLACPWTLLVTGICPVLPPGMLCLGLGQGWELAGAELLLPTWPRHCVLGHFEKSLYHPQSREIPSMVGASLDRQAGMAVGAAGLGCAKESRRRGKTLGAWGRTEGPRLLRQSAGAECLDGGGGGALAGCPTSHQQGEETHPSASWGGTALPGPEHPRVRVPRMDGIPGVDAVLAIIWGLLPTVQE